jgi:hypothetical protein
VCVSGDIKKSLSKLTILWIWAKVTQVLWNMPSIFRKYFYSDRYVTEENTLAYRPVAKWWLCKQRQLLGNAGNIQPRNNRKTVFSGVGPAAVSRQRLGQHVHVATNMHATIELFLETVFRTRLCKGVIWKTIEATQSVENSVLYGRLCRKVLVVRCGCEEKTLFVIFWVCN